MNGIASRLKAVNELGPEKRKVLLEEVYDPHIDFVDRKGLPMVLRSSKSSTMDSTSNFPDSFFTKLAKLKPIMVLRVHSKLVKPGASVKPTGDDFIKIKDGRITEVYVIVNGQTKQTESAANNNH